MSVDQTGPIWFRSLTLLAPALRSPLQHGLKDKGFIATNEWHDIVWEIGLDRMRVLVDGEVRFEGEGDYRGIVRLP